MSLNSSPTNTVDLPVLTSLLENYSQQAQEPIHAHLLSSHGEIVEFSLTNDSGNLVIDATLTQNFLVATQNLLNSGTIPPNAVINIDTSLSHEDIGDYAVEDNPGDLEGVPTTQNDGLALHRTLTRLGHTKGYSPSDIDYIIKKRGGITLPELRFYRSTVRDGKIADGPFGDILASHIEEDFGASDLADAQLPRIPAQPSDVVQPLLSHRLWVEIAHDTDTLYAVDLAPGASGAKGQVISRDPRIAEPPRLLARSFSDFVTGNWVNEEERRKSWGVLEDSSAAQWISSTTIKDDSAYESQPQQEQAVSAVTMDSLTEPASSQVLADGSLPVEEETPSTESDTISYRSQVDEFVRQTRQAEQKSQEEFAQDFATHAFGDSEESSAVDPETSSPSSDESLPVSAQEKNLEAEREEPKRRHFAESEPESVLKAAVKKFFLG
ncbi:hypothetical protein ACN08X_04880 [Rothia sp. P6271]|uniref:hypothetical protein n=1 Tax=Rothia sp. P6271 TaxID=3402659 RepID=UPI003ACEB25E